MTIALQPPPVNTPLASKDGQVDGLWSRFFVNAQQTVVTDCAPADARYVVTTANPSLTAEVNLGALSAGYLKQTVAAGVASPSTTATIPASDLTGALPALDASALTNLNATALASGTVPDGRFPATLPAASGVNLTALNASNLASGTVPDGRFPATLPAASGVNLTALNASNLGSGTVPQARLPFVLDAGTYTPTLTNSVNVAASTAYVCQYLRVGAVVTVSGRVDVDPTAAGDTQLGISLPITSNLASATQCAGTGVAPGIAGQSAAVLGDATNDRATLEWIAVDTTNQPFFFTATYVVI